MLRSKVVRVPLTLLIVWAGQLCFAAAVPAVRPCATCHPAENARFQASAMGRSLIAPEALPAGQINHQTSGAVITTEERDGRMVHKISESGLTAEFPVRYQIGGGLMGRTYMVQIGDALFESPASWFNRYGWDVSPGYQHMQSIDFDRPMEEQCLFCHAGSARFDPDGRQLKKAALTAITCERCHGSGDAHALHPSTQNIVNPAKLTGPARDSVCEQCHLEGATRVLNPGKHWTDFHPGQPTEQTFGTYLLENSSKSDVIAVSHVEQLAQSQCALRSQGRLWCGSCHDPHGVKAADRPREIRAVCLSCHATLSPVSHGTAAPAECTSCHMPRSSTTDIAHAAITDHRILRHPTDRVPTGLSGEQTVVSWRDPPASVRGRNLALAQVVIGYSKNLPASSEAGFTALHAIPENLRNQDPTVLSDLEGFALQQDVAEAVKLGRQAVELQPQNAKVAMNFGLVLKKSGDLAEAEHQLSRAIDLDPSLKQAYMELGMLYASERQIRPMIDTIDRYLRWNPQDIMFRSQKARFGAQP